MRKEERGEERRGRYSELRREGRFRDTRTGENREAREIHKSWKG